MRKRQEFSNFGFSTILLCFVMICVVTFSALSLVSAYSDYKLSKKVADKNQHYYDAQMTAYEKISRLDQLAVDTYASYLKEDEFRSFIKTEVSSYGTIRETADSLFLTFTEPICENQYLQVTLKISFPQKNTDAFINITEWKSCHNELSPEDTFLDLIQ